MSPNSSLAQKGGKKRQAFVPLLCLCAAVMLGQAQAADNRTIDLKNVAIEQIELKIPGKNGSITLHKICLDGQAYWFSPESPHQQTLLTPVFKNGSPQMCLVKNPVPSN